MRKIIKFFLLTVFLVLPYSTYALLSMELTQGMAGAVPIAITPFTGGEQAPQDMSGIISTDLQNSGRFKVYNNESQSVDNAVVGSVQSLGGNRYEVQVKLLEVLKDKSQGSMLFNKKYQVSGSQLRSLAHHISDVIYQQITGIRGVFSTKLAYVVVQRSANAPTRYMLEVCDQDGENPRPLLTSTDPIMSPSWAPNGKQIAYVSFENRHAAIYLEDVATGSRHLISEFPGINGAPAWSPDSRKLALVLSKNGSPSIYIMDIATRRLTQLTKDWYINTEPTWSKDGGSLLFTSNRSGGPQIYQMNLATGAVSRVTYDGAYNARASFTPDNNHIAVIHRDSGLYQIALLDLDTNALRVLSNSAGDSASPSVAPNGSMVLYDTVYQGQNVLAMVSTDGRIQLRLPARNGQAQDPAWSPFLS